jgi:hypothetical protein
MTNKYWVPVLLHVLYWQHQSINSLTIKKNTALYDQMLTEYIKIILSVLG